MFLRLNLYHSFVLVTVLRVAVCTLFGRDVSGTCWRDFVFRGTKIGLQALPCAKYKDATARTQRSKRTRACVSQVKPDEIGDRIEKMQMEIRAGQKQISGFLANGF